MTQDPSSANADGIFEPFSTEDVPWEEFAEGERFAIRYRRVGDFGGATRVGVAIEELAPGKQSCPAHYHMLEEEHVFILAGHLTLRLGDRTYRMSAGDYACFPAGQAAGHAFLNESDETCRYLILGERNPHEVVVYTDSGRVGVRLTGEGYRKSDTMDYWEGVETR